MKKKMGLRKLYLKRQHYIYVSETIKKKKENIIKTVFWMIETQTEGFILVKLDLLVMLK